MSQRRKNRPSAREPVASYEEVKYERMKQLISAMNKQLHVAKDTLQGKLQQAEEIEKTIQQIEEAKERFFEQHEKMEETIEAIKLPDNYAEEIEEEHKKINESKETFSKMKAQQINIQAQIKAMDELIAKYSADNRQKEQQLRQLEKECQQALRTSDQQSEEFESQTTYVKKILQDIERHKSECTHYQQLMEEEEETDREELVYELDNEYKRLEEQFNDAQSLYESLFSQARALVEQHRQARLAYIYALKEKKE